MVPSGVFPWGIGASMKKTYEKPVLEKREKLSKVVASVPSR